MLGGRAADRHGRVPVIATSLLVSGVCCMVSPVVLGAEPLWLTAFCVLWGAAAVADSAVLTTATIEVADPRYTGTALTVQTALGFLLTVAGIATVPVVAAAVGWQTALVVLAVGPALGLPAVLALRRYLPTAAPAPSPVTFLIKPAEGLQAAGRGMTDCPCRPMIWGVLSPWPEGANDR
ncbi:MFS transporter [Pseudonocardia sp. ICBG1293]|uniref:MFS transporter n=1 Tax=Pseudonocardia sp. ICBG1293 TaxID=2844382 RepID=UPI0027E0AC0A|nr:MFS transporter [Pseudonocardia sp. ICBG1293]